MASEAAEIGYATRWESKKISKDSKIFEADSPMQVFQSCAVAEGKDAHKTHKIDSQVLTIDFETQASPETDTQPLTYEICASAFDTLDEIPHLFEPLIGFAVGIENNTLVICSETRFAITENEEGLIDALGLHAVHDA